MEITEKKLYFKPAPFSEDYEAIQDSEQTEANKKIRIYSDGIFDLFHQGHQRQLMQAKNLFRNVHLIVGVINDFDTKTKKGETIMSENERYENVRHSKYADEVLKNAPWIIDENFILKHKIDYVCHDDLPYIDKDGNDIYKFLRDRGMFIATQRTEGVSTSDLVCRVICNYDLYVRRNLERGYTPEELNISVYLKNKLKLEKQLRKFGIFTKKMKENLIRFLWHFSKFWRKPQIEAKQE